GRKNKAASELAAIGILGRCFPEIGVFARSAGLDWGEPDAGDLPACPPGAREAAPRDPVAPPALSNALAHFAGGRTEPGFREYRDATDSVAGREAVETYCGLRLRVCAPLREAVKLLDEINEEGMGWLRKGEPKRALAFFDRVLRLHPRHVSALMNKATASLAAGDPDGALEPLDRVIELGSGAGGALPNARLMRAEAAKKLDRERGKGFE
ncbi:tetratricopeptide repeat protein, partial [Elusimicrobiota bacterium]